ncbi:hypothetical protein COT64_01995 [Candidatus Shapirobacteria bacterium CG09_land_8_20_14_0_10_39_12]|uniref:Uncharacterized protein n=1 Tax=Candidatus Shapirobacteria bacterium CG09_land_8_20_14_0_10_39_12 TaxID=1974885 RepID=A0A2H0WPI3_9BACT|nr:MAG: hypothetical protein COT64_01995 [Candidatus Shapirobacteria bacterium CG09_land_8_20_14_0_10_39_12]
MKKRKICLLPFLGGLLVILILLFVGVLQVKGARERYCLAQTHLQFPIDVPMDGDKWDFFSSCYNQLTLSDAGKIFLGSRRQELSEAKRIAELNAVMTKYPNKDSQQYKAAREEFCVLTGRPAEEREQAVANIRQYLGMTDIPVDFICSRFNTLPGDTGTDYNNPAIEHYEAALFGFQVDPKTNYIVEVGEAERRWGTNEDGTRWFENMPKYDNTPRYTTPESIKPVAEAFMTKNQDIFGVDISQMTYEYRGSKIENHFVKWTDYNSPHTKEHEMCGDVDRDNEAAYQNDKGAWCIKQTDTLYPTVFLTITQGGQVAVYDNDGFEIDKL